MSRVGFDLDGVVYDFRQALSDHLVAQGMLDCTVDRVHPNWDFYEGWGLDLNGFLKHFKDGVDAGTIFRIGEPLEGAVEATKRLAAAGHTVHIVTDRSVGTEPGASARATAAWLADHGFVFHSLTISSDKTSVPTDVFIEDKLENYDALVAAGVDAYLVNREWNEIPGGDDRQRVDSVAEFVDRVIA